MNTKHKPAKHWAEVVEGRLSDGSTVYDVMLSAGGERVAINAVDMESAYLIRDAIREHAVNFSCYR
jgi:hypothetical protein